MLEPRNVLLHLFLAMDKPHTLKREVFNQKWHSELAVGGRSLLQSMMSHWTVAASECHGGYEQSCVGFWHWPSNPKKQFGVYKPRLSHAQLWCVGQRVGVRMLQAMCWRVRTGSDPCH